MREEIHTIDEAIQQGELPLRLQLALMSLKGSFLELIKTGKVGLPYEADWGLPEPSRLEGSMTRLRRREDGVSTTYEGRFVFDSQAGAWCVRDTVANNYKEDLTSLDEAKGEAAAILSREIIRFMWVEALKTARLRKTKDVALMRIIRVGAELLKAFPMKADRTAIEDIARELYEQSGEGP